MHWALQTKSNPGRAGRWGAALALLFGLTACNREAVRVYQIPKEKPEPAATAAAPDHDHNHAHPHGADGAQPHIHYEAPPGWAQQPVSGIRVARFSIAGKHGQDTDVSVIPLAGVMASKLDIVNLWREQIRVGPAKEEELAGLAEPVAIGETPGELYDIVSTEPLIDDKLKARILVAMMKLGERTWFFKMTGEDESVRDQKAAFVAFLKTVTVDESDHGAPGGPAVAGASAGTGASRAGSAAGRPEWEVPAGWQEVPPTQMLVGKFNLPGAAGGKAEVTVSVFPGDVGGLLANVNRWRQQIGLPPVAGPALTQLAQPLDVPGGQATVVDMQGKDAKSGNSARLIGVVLPQGDRTWFYKLMGDGAVAEQEKAAFLKFVQTAKHPNA